MTWLGVRRLALGQFRSYRSARLDLDRRPVVIVGPNGAGKTNLLEAVSFLSPGRGLRSAGGEELVRHGAEGWRVVATLDAPDGRHDVATEGARLGGRRVELDGKAAPQVALGALLRVLWLTPAMDRLWTEAPAERRRFLDRVAMSLDPGHAEAAIGYDRALRERNRLIRDGVGDRSWFAAIEAQMAEAGARLGAGRRAAVAGLAAASVEGPFPAADLAVESEAPADADAFAAALAEGRARDIAAGRSLLGPHRDDLAAIWAAKGVPARLCSTGEQKALLISTLLANARAVAAAFGAPPILLFDEVAAHLDEGRRADLFATLGALGCQAWMTGTEAGLFSAWRDAAQWIEVRDGPDGSEAVSAPPPAEPGRPPAV